MVLGVFKGVVDGMDDVITCISSWKYAYKSQLLSFEWGEEEILKDKSGTSEKSQVLGDESRRLIGGLSKKGYDINDYDI